MIYVVVASYEVYNPGSGYSDLMDINECVTDNKEDIRNIKELTYSYVDVSSDKKYTVTPISIDVELWQKGKRIGSDSMDNIKQLKGWANE